MIIEQPNDFVKTVKNIAQSSSDLVNKEYKIRVGLWINDNKEMFDSMHQRKDEIEAALRVLATI